MGSTNLMPLHVMPHWSVMLWVLWMLAFVVLEILGIKRSHNMVPLTWVVRAHAPKWLLAMAVGWLLYHFVVV